MQGGGVFVAGGRCAPVSAADVGGEAVEDGSTGEADVRCDGAEACESGRCPGRDTCAEATCDDGMVNGDETDVDCGGRCAPCAVDDGCEVDADCRTHRCAEGGRCAEPTCDDGSRNGEETDVDCGGPTCEPCDDGERCEEDGDCLADRRCASGEGDAPGVCRPIACDNGVRDGSETAVDCGGSCDRCGIGASCEVDSDCESERCLEETCVEATCDDGLRNQDETDVDCGESCSPCAAGEACESGGDCRSGVCSEASDGMGEVCQIGIAGKLTAGDPGRWTDGSYAESCDGYENPQRPNHVRSYTDLDRSASSTDRNGIYQIKPSGAGDAYTVYCEMLRYNRRGGWTLVLISADDGEATWTWNNRALLTTKDPSTVGSPEERRRDFKSAAYHDLAAEDLLFVYRNEAGADRWLAYDDLGTGNASLASLTEMVGSTCYADSSPDRIRDGFESDAGNVQAGGSLCSTDMYLNAKDQGGNAYCTEEEEMTIENAFGPTWSAEAAEGCPMDDPGQEGSLGPSVDPASVEHDSRGFAGPLGLSGPNDRIEVYVR